MANKQKRFNFSIVSMDGKYMIECDETKELVSGKISSLKKARELIKGHISTEHFKEISTNLTVEQVRERVKLFGGRLRPKKKPWTIEEALLVAKLYQTRGELYEKNPKLYSSAYAKNWMDQICAHMKPSNKKHKYVYGILNPNAALAKIFDYPTHFDFCKANQGAYNALRKFGVDTIELFENRDDATYLKNTIRQLADVTVHNLVE